MNIITICLVLTGEILDQVVYPLVKWSLGVLLTSFIGYMFTRVVNNEIAKFSIKKDSVERVFELISKAEQLEGLIFSNILSIKSYNYLVDNEEFSHWKHVHSEIMRSTDKMSEISEKFGYKSKALLDVGVFLESKEAIFHEYIGFRYKLFDYQSISMKYFYDWTNYFYDEVSSYIDGKNKVPVNIMNEYEAKFELAIKATYDITPILHDLKVELQNDFYQKYFKHHVNCRVQSNGVQGDKKGMEYEFSSEYKKIFGDKQ